MQSGFDERARLQREIGYRRRTIRREADSGAAEHGSEDVVFSSHSGLISAARTVFAISIAIVIGPTPPGTGVILEATFLTDSKSTSPCSLKPIFAFLSSPLFVPTSPTTAPFFTMSPLTIPARPAATIRML